MTKKTKNSLLGALFPMFFFFGFWLWLKSFNGDFIILMVIFGLSYLLPRLLLALVPIKNAKKKATKKKSSKQKTTYTTKKEHNLLRSEKEILTLPLEDLTWREFERLCYLYYKAKGYKPIETSEGADGGVDLVIYNRHHRSRVAIQIKHRKTGNSVTVEEIRQLVSAKRNHNCTLAEFITTSTYTRAAINEAEDRKIETRDKEWVKNKILAWRDQEVKKRNLA